MESNEIYRKFWLETLPFDWPIRFGYDWFCSAIDYIWEAKSRKTDWLGFESFVRDVLTSPKLIDKQRVDLLKDAVGAFTGRGKAE